MTEDCLKCEIEAEYQREWKEYWRAQYNMATNRIPFDETVQEPCYCEIRGKVKSKHI